MTEPFIAEIRMFPYTFVPRGYALCNGQLMPISQNTALFSLLGTTYGGDGKSTFGIPRLSGAVAMGAGRGPGLTERKLGEEDGSNGVTLLPDELPSHNHGLTTTILAGSTTNPAGMYLGHYAANPIYAENPNPSTLVNMAPQSLSTAGESNPHENRQPALGIAYCIAVEGIFPSRN